MPYVTSIERIARSEGKTEGKSEGRSEGRSEGKVQLLQDLLGLPVTSDADFEQMTKQQIEELLIELRQRFDSR